MEPYSFGAPLISARNRRYSDGLDSWGHRGRTMRRLFLVAAFATSLQFASAANTPVRAGGGRCDGRPHRWPRGRDHYRCRSCRSTLRRTARRPLLASSLGRDSVISMGCGAPMIGSAIFIGQCRRSSSATWKLFFGDVLAVGCVLRKPQGGVKRDFLLKPKIAEQD